MKGSSLYVITNQRKARNVLVIGIAEVLGCFELVLYGIREVTKQPIRAKYLNDLDHGECTTLATRGHG